MLLSLRDYFLGVSHHNHQYNFYTLTFSCLQTEATYCGKLDNRNTILFRLSTIIQILIVMGQMTKKVNEDDMLQFQLEKAGLLTYGVTSLIIEKYLTENKLLILDIMIALRMFFSTCSQFQFFRQFGQDEDGIFWLGIIFGLYTGVSIWISFYWWTKIAMMVFATAYGQILTETVNMLPVLAVLLCLFLFRLKEIDSRGTFYTELVKTQKLDACLQILNTSIGQSLLVIGNKYEVLYSNEVFQSTFKIGDSQGVQKLLKLNDGIYNEVEQIMGDLQSLNSQTQVYCSSSYRQTNLISFDNKFDAYISTCLWNNTQAILIIFRDISDKELKQTFMEQNRYKDQLLASISHDLKTPLNGVEILTSTLLEKYNTQDDLLSSSLKCILTNSQLLLCVINDIIDYSQLNLKGSLRLNQSKFDINTLVMQVKQLFIAQIEHKGIELIVHSSMKNTEICSDRERLKQILVNLVGNAVKFTFKGQIEIMLIDIGRDKLLIQVQDSGIGISELTLKTLFHTNNIRGSNQHGIGLGLTIASRLVELLGDELSVKSSINVGSSFQFRLVKNTSEEVSDEGKMQCVRITRQSSIWKNQQCTSQTPTQQLIRVSPRILIVDDTPINLIALQHMIHQITHFVIIELAYNGLQAFEKARQCHYELIFMDINMPVMDGIESTKKIRELEFRPMIVMLSAFSGSEIDDAMAAGADDYIKKPPERERIKGILHSLQII